MQVNKKAVLLGTTSVGKTSLAIRMLDNTFSDKTQPTLSGNSLTIKCDDGSSFTLWDTAGQERYKALASLFFQNACAGILVFDLNNPETLEPLRAIVTEFAERAVIGAKIFLVGNKSDIEKKIEQETINEFTNDISNCAYYETSALNGNGVTELKESICHFMNSFKAPSYDTPIAKQEKSGDDHNCC